MLLAEGAKGRPWDILDATSIAFKHVVPLLGRVCQMERGEPNLGVLARLLPADEVFAFVQPSQRIGLAIKRRERELVDAMAVAQSGWEAVMGSVES